MGQGNPITSISYGVEVIHGLMGAGKSFFAVRRCVREVLTTRRPLYTNLPLKFPVVRRYMGLQGGRAVTNLIRRLDEEHWRRFLRRQHDYAKFREALKKKCPADLAPDRLADLASAVGEDPAKIARQSKIFDRQVSAWYQHLHGPNIIDGPDANWIPPTAIICIDEVQHWHPMTKQKDDHNREDLLAYLTMIRHHGQWLWVITQDASRIAIEFRLLARYFWRVWDRGEDRLAWGLRFKHFRIRAMGYECATKEQLENKDPENARPIDRFTVIPSFPWNRVLFRLYSSHTNIGSARAMLRDLRRAREFAGLDAEGHTSLEVAMTTAAPPKPSIFRRFLVLLRRVLVLVICATAAYAAGSYFATPPAQEVNHETPTVVELPPLTWPRWTGAGASPWIDRKRVRQGEWINPRVMLEHVDPGGRRLVLRVDGAEWWVWSWPDAEPIRVGTIDDVRSAVDRLRRSDLTGVDPAKP